MRHVFALVILVLLALWMFAASTNALAEGTTVPPSAVKLVDASPLIEHLDLKCGTFRAVFNLSVENDSAKSIPYAVHGGDGYEFSVISDRIYSKSADAPTIVPYAKPSNHQAKPKTPKPSTSKSASAAPKPSASKCEPSAPKMKTSIPLAPTAVTPVPVILILTAHDLTTTSLTVVLRVTSPPGVVPSTETITLTRSPKARNYIGILAGSLGMGALVFLVLLGDHRWKAKLKPSARRQRLIYTDATFSFSQSWATSIAALLTIVATVFSTTGVLASLIPGVDSGFFLAVTIVYGMVLALAPLVYSTLQGSEGDHSHSYGTRRGFVIAATITGVAVGGQLSTLGAIIALSDLSFSLRVTIIVLIAVVAGLIIAYTAATRRQLWRLPKPTIHSTTNRPAPADRRPALP